jgi:hypothetical protein
MANFTRSMRGDVNAILNGLVRDGVIAGFQTSFDSDYALAPRVRVTVLVGSAVKPDVVKSTVAEALDRFKDRLSVRVKAA